VTGVRRTLAVAAAAALVALGPAAVRPASAADSGKPGYCADDAGVTVVVDFRELGGDVVVRCAPGPGGQGFTGLDALTEAGYQVAGTQRWGMQFVCRIQGRPAGNEDLEIPGDDSYREDCGGTPPETAYWTYWYASNGGDWKYSSVSAASRSTIKGGFEGWSFHLGASSPSPPPIAPKHAVSAPTSSPATKPPGGGQHGGGQHSGGQHGDHGPGGGPGGPDPTSATSAPTTGSPSTTPPDGGHDEPRHGTRSGQSTAPLHPTTKPPESATSTRSAPAAGSTVTTALPNPPDGGGGGGAMPFLIGAGIVVLLGAGAGATAWQRSRRG
jgi:hypothetical protein